MFDIQLVGKNLDLVYSPDDSGFYFQEYKNDGKGTTRESVVYTTRFMAMQALNGNYIKWHDWN